MCFLDTKLVTSAISLVPLSFPYPLTMQLCARYCSGPLRGGSGPEEEMEILHE